MFFNKDKSKTDTSDTPPTPSRDALFKFVKLWQDLQARTKQLDEDRNNFARDLRKQFPSKANVQEGDEQFKTWCIANLKVNEFEARELLTRAMAAIVFTTKDELVSASGETGTRGTSAFQSISTLPRAEQVTIMQQAKAQKLTIAKVKRDRGHEKPAKKVTPAVDATTFAELINKFVLAGKITWKDVPSPVREKMALYVKKLAL